MFGGNNGGCGGNVTFGDTWAWNGSSWVQPQPATSPAPRAGAGMAPNAGSGGVLLFGGQDPNAYPGDGLLIAVFNDTWAWDGNAQTWTQQFPAVAPPARALIPNEMVFDASTGTVVVFGGSDGAWNALGDTWTWDGTAWTQQFPPVSPPARLNHAMAYDAHTGMVVVFGGQPDTSGYTIFGDTWTWDGATWTQQFPPVSPPARGVANMTYDDASGSTVLFGGTDGMNFYQDTWVWNGTTWAQIFPATTPPDRYAAVMAFDNANQSVVLFGGYSSGCQLNDTWVGAGSAFSAPGPASTARTPSTLGGASRGGHRAGDGVRWAAPRAQQR
jgi:hypothetical protein